MADLELMGPVQVDLLTEARRVAFSFERDELPRTADILKQLIEEIVTLRQKLSAERQVAAGTGDDGN